MIGVLVISDVQIFREGLVIALMQASDFEVWQSPQRTQDALRAVRRHQPKVVLVDLRGPDGLSLIPQIARTAPHIAQIAMAVSDEPRHILACAEAGASGFVAHNASLEDLAQAITDADRGALRCPPQVAHSLFCHVGKLCAGSQNSAANPLTDRERQILDLIERGHPNKAIADELGIGVSTVKNHVHSVLAKLGVRRRGEAAAYHRRNSL